MLQRSSGGNYPAITSEELKKLIVPIPLIETQQKIISKIKQAYNLKKQKEAEAQQLLDSINDYVLDELGIKFSRIEEEKIYCINSEELENNRSDPYYFNPKFKKILRDLEKSKIKLMDLKEVSIKIFNGKTPAKEDYAEEGNLILKVNCLKNNKVLWDNLSYFNDGVPAVKTIKNKDILLLSSAHQGEYLGRNPCIAEIPESLKDKKIYFVGEIISIRADPDKINPYYLLAILKLNEYYLLINREKRGQTSHLYPEDLGNVKIPLPPLEIQNKIAEEVKKRMKKAEQLQKEAKEILERAKQEVERIILS
jgi:type I restriction enzyme M protein